MMSDTFIVSGTVIVVVLLVGMLLGMAVQVYIDADKNMHTIERLEEDLLTYRVALLPFAWCERPLAEGMACGDCDGCRAYAAIARERDLERERAA